MFHVTVSRFTISASNPTLNKPSTAGGSMKIANEIIEEVDEQATITSMGRRPENRLVENLVIVSKDI